MTLITYFNMSVISAYQVDLHLYMIYMKKLQGNNQHVKIRQSKVTIFFFFVSLTLAHFLKLS